MSNRQLQIKQCKLFKKHLKLRRVPKYRYVEWYIVHLRRKAEHDTLDDKEVELVQALGLDLTPPRQRIKIKSRALMALDDIGNRLMDKSEKSAKEIMADRSEASQGR